MEISELRQLTTKKLWETLAKVRRELAVAKFHVKTSQSTNAGEIRSKKIAIARILTLLNRDNK